MAARLTTGEVRAYLDSRPGWIVLTALGPDGFPHSVPIGYFRVGDEVYIGCRAGTRKLKNIAGNSRVSLLLESGSTMQDIKGVMIQGEVTVYTDLVLCSASPAGLLAGEAEQRASSPRSHGQGRRTSG